MSRKLFYEDQYQKEYVCKITDVLKKDDKILVVLDNSPFYPTGGGQPCDLGWINGQPVIDVFEKDGVIYNQLPKAPDSYDAVCRIDFPRRFDLMQQHTGEHLLSAAFLKLYNGANHGFHIGDEYVTIDINLPEITDDMISMAELEANSYIYKNVKVKSYFVGRDQSASMPLRTKIKVKDETIRIVDIGDIDICACCGVHLDTTSETGIVKINKVEKYKGMTRVYFRCGLRALRDYDNKQKIVSELVKISASEESKLPERFASQLEKISFLSKELQIYRKKAAEAEALSILEESETELIFKEYGDKDFDDVQMISAVVTAENRIFIGLSLADKKIILCHNGYSEVHCGNIFKSNIKKYAGKGGGDSKRSQGTFTTDEDLKKFAEFVLNEIQMNI
ncbi:MAG: alanyl-tRNA editing protein [Clostridiaceae bacterium]